MSTETEALNQNEATRTRWRVAETDHVLDIVPLLKSGADMNAGNVHGVTALMRASEHGRELMVRALLEYGADPNVARSDKFNALLLASFFGHEQVVRILISHGADINAVSRFETT